MFEALRKEGFDIARVVAPAVDDRLALAARSAGVPLQDGGSRTGTHAQARYASRARIPSQVPHLHRHARPSSATRRHK